MSNPSVGNVVARIVTSLAFAVVGCGGGGSPTVVNGGGGGGNGGGGGGGGGPVATTSVNVGDNFFDPEAILVSGGATITWTWVGSGLHNVTFSSGGVPASPTQTSGSYQAAMPSAAGQYGYSCTIHGFTGSVTVQ